MEQQLNRSCDVNAQNQKKSKTKSCQIQIDRAFNLAYKQYNGIIKRWFQYLTGQTEDFLTIIYCLAQHDIWSWRKSNFI